MNPREVMMIVTLLICLFAVLALRTSCAQGVANLFRAMEPPAAVDGGVGATVTDVTDGPAKNH